MAGGTIDIWWLTWAAIMDMVQVYLLCFTLEGDAGRQSKWMTPAEFREESQETMPNVSSLRIKKWESSIQAQEWHGSFSC